jgi:hypothetical protein
LGWNRQIAPLSDRGTDVASAGLQFAGIGGAFCHTAGQISGLRRSGNFLEAYDSKLSTEELDGGEYLMGSHSKQGWFLFLFMVGFTFLVAGLAYMPIIFALLGLIAIIVSLVGFHQIKPLEDGVEEEQPAAASAASGAKAGGL